MKRFDQGKGESYSVGFLSPYGIRIVSSPVVTRGEAWPTSESQGTYVVHPDDFERLADDARHAEVLKARKWETWKHGATALTEQR